MNEVWLTLSLYTHKDAADPANKGAQVHGSSIAWVQSVIPALPPGFPSTRLTAVGFRVLDLGVLGFSRIYIEEVMQSL